jgi:hypothetical protein
VAGLKNATEHLVGKPDLENLTRNPTNSAETQDFQAMFSEHDVGESQPSVHAHDRRRGRVVSESQDFAVLIVAEDHTITTPLASDAVASALEGRPGPGPFWLSREHPSDCLVF